MDERVGRRVAGRNVLGASVPLFLKEKLCSPLATLTTSRFLHPMLVWKSMMLAACPNCLSCSLDLSSHSRQALPYAGYPCGDSGGTDLHHSVCIKII